MTKKKLKHVGLHTHRFDNNPEELRFAEAWDEFAGNNLKYLLSSPVSGAGNMQDCTVEELTITATVVQWLGSPVGQHFLAELGYVRVNQIDAATIVDDLKTVRRLSDQLIADLRHLASE